MKKFCLHFFLLLTFTSSLFLAGCEEEEEPARNEPPKVAFSINEGTLRGINLDTKGPAITGTVQADAGLQEVTVELLKGSETVVLENVTTFDEVTRIIYVVNVQPEYTPEVTGLRVSGVDQQGRTVEKAVEIITYTGPKLNPEEGLPGTVVTMTGPAFSASNITGLKIGETAVEEYTVAPDGSNITFKVPAGAETGPVSVVPAEGFTMVTAKEFTVLSEAPKEMNTYAEVIVNAQGERNTAGVVTAFSATGELFTLAEGADEAVSSRIDFITADSGGDNKLDLFSPSHSSWLPNNYFKKEVEGDMTWPVLNATKLAHLEDKDVEFFTNITQEELAALTIDEPSTRIALSTEGAGAIILFETRDGKKGLLHFKAHDPNAAVGSKADIFTFDIKVLEEVKK